VIYCHIGVEALAQVKPVIHARQER